MDTYSVGVGTRWCQYLPHLPVFQVDTPALDFVRETN